MIKLSIIPIELIIDINFNLTGIICDLHRRETVHSCYSSYIYYDTLQEKITSIIVSLIKGHFFVDGNKRTAFVTYITLAKINNLKYIEDTEEQVNIFVEIAISHMNIAEYAKMLFSE